MLSLAPCSPDALDPRNQPELNKFLPCIGGLRQSTAPPSRWKPPVTHSTIRRIVRSAATLVRERGVHGVGLRQIVAHADGPRGSLQRYFPGGKTQLITEALKLAGAEVLDDTESGLIEAATPADAIDAIFAPLRQLLVESNFTMGCPIAATVVDACGEDRLRQEARALLDQWRDSVRAGLVKFGVQESTAADDASVLLAALEGALDLEPSKSKHPATRHGAALLHHVADAGRSQPRRSRAT